ncbi:hypothetical protein D3C71_1663640 [compost metagenome]
MGVGGQVAHVAHGRFQFVAALAQLHQHCVHLGHGRPHQRVDAGQAKLGQLIDYALQVGPAFFQIGNARVDITKDAIEEVFGQRRLAVAHAVGLESFWHVGPAYSARS